MTIATDNEYLLLKGHGAQVAVTTLLAVVLFFSIS